MSIPYIQASMANVRAVDGTFTSYPFIEDGDTDTKVYNMACTQKATDYSASQIALDTRMSSAASAGVISLPFSNDAGAYFVGDTAHSPIGGGMLSFTRTFANIPKSITLPSGSSFVTFPGMSRSVTPSSGKAVSNITMTLGELGVTVTTEAEHGLVVGNQVYLSAALTIDSDPFVHQIAGQYIVIEAPTTTTFRIDIGQYWDNQVTINATDTVLRQVDFKRQPTSINVSTQTHYEYILPGVTPGISSILNIELPKTFGAISTDTGDPVETLEQFSTIPTIGQYIDMIQEGRNIVIESSLSRWAGNILLLKTKTCKAR